MISVALRAIETSGSAWGKEAPSVRQDSGETPRT
jgi:hypothetical protein